MFNRNKDKENKKENKVKEKALNASKEVKVVSKIIFNERVVVVTKKIITKAGPIREVFNSYLFDTNGECVMPERDAILFWKDQKEIKARKNDISVFSLKNDIEYEFNKIKDLYEVEEVDLEGSKPRN